MKTLKIRKFEIGDVNEIIYVTKRSNFKYKEGFFLRFHRRFPDLFIVSEVDGKIVGYTLARIKPRFSNIHPKFLSLFIKKIMHKKRIPENIRMLCLSKRGHGVLTAVSPDFRRKGIANMLLTKRDEEMKKRGIKKVDTHVRVSNIPTRKLCKKIGYKEKTIISNYYDDGESAVLFEKEI